jgi:hypothetical protein
MRTVFEMKRLPENDHKSLKDLARPAYELLLECERTITNFEEGECSFKKGILIVTGRQRVREDHIRLVELFYEQTYALDPKVFSRGGGHQFYKWRTNDAMPHSWCLEAAPKFRSWNARRRSETERQKRLRSAKPKWDDKTEASSKLKEEEF